MVVIICGKYGNNRSRTENVTERTRFSKSRSNDLEDIGQGQGSSHATHLLMLVIICIKYGKNPSRTVDATERTRFSRPRPVAWEFAVKLLSGEAHSGCPATLSQNSLTFP